MTSRPKQNDQRSGGVLVVILILVLVLTLFGGGLLEQSTSVAIETSKQIALSEAFWLADGGIQRAIKRAYNETYNDIGQTTAGKGTYSVSIHKEADPPYAISTGQVGDRTKQIKVILEFLPAPYEEAIAGGNASGDPWSFNLRGEGDPTRTTDGWRVYEQNGKDIVNGSIYANGNVNLFEESRVNDPLSPNTYNLSGDVEATGEIHLDPDTSVEGTVSPEISQLEWPDIPTMDYANNSTYDIAAIFDALNIDHGRLPVGHPLRDVVVKNPLDRNEECDSTVGDDFFFEDYDEYGSESDSTQARTPLHLGEDEIYYVDGHAWFHKEGPLGFMVDGVATIAATRDIHISDNIGYADRDRDALGLIAMGIYDTFGNVIDGGDIYFGDPRFGTTYRVDAFMFAGNDFLYNIDSINGETQEPDTGFEVFGNFAAVNEVKINRDWYDEMITTAWTRTRPRRRVTLNGDDEWILDDGSVYNGSVRNQRTEAGDPQPAYYDTESGTWRDLITGEPLSEDAIERLRHYRMIVSYDERIRDPATQPPGLPKGRGEIFAGVGAWEELTDTH